MNKPIVPLLVQVRSVSSGTLSCLVRDNAETVSRFRKLDSRQFRVVNQIREDWVLFSMGRQDDFQTWQDSWEAFVAQGAPSGFRVDVVVRYRRLHDVLCKACLLTPGEAVSALAGFPSEAVCNMGGSQKAIKYAFQSRHRYRKKATVNARIFDNESDLYSYLEELDRKGLLYHLDDSPDGHTYDGHTYDGVLWSVPVSQKLLGNLQTNHDRLWQLSERMGIDPFQYLPAST